MNQEINTITYTGYRAASEARIARGWYNRCGDYPETRVPVLIKTEIDGKDFFEPSELSFRSAAYNYGVKRP